MEFEKLSLEGRYLKVVEHVREGWSVPPLWVQWLLDNGFGTTLAAYDGIDVSPAFYDLPEPMKIVKIRVHISLGMNVPASWVKWLIEEQAPLSLRARRADAPSL